MAVVSPNRAHGAVQKMEARLIVRFCSDDCGSPDNPSKYARSIPYAGFLFHCYSHPLFSSDDEHHARCGKALDSLTAPFFTCWPVITEAAYLLRKRPEAVARMFAGFAGGFFSFLPLDADDVKPIAAIIHRYESAGLQLADAALAHLADREKISTLFTLDCRDFSLIRLKRNRALRLIPEVQ